MTSTDRRIEDVLSVINELRTEIAANNATTKILLERVTFPDYLKVSEVARLLEMSPGRVRRRFKAFLVGIPGKRGEFIHRDHVKNAFVSKRTLRAAESRESKAVRA